jgi:hypothetical protein
VPHIWKELTSVKARHLSRTVALHASVAAALAFLLLLLLLLLLFP